MKKINLIICGVCGRMGSLLVELALKDSDFFVKGGIEIKNHPMIGKEIKSGVKVFDTLEKIVEKDDIIVDFTVPEATINFLEIVKEKKGKIVIGTTGFKEEQILKIKEVSVYVPVFLSPNMSIGVNLFFEIIRYATKLLKNYEIEIQEIHHHFKKDAPSGTAKKIAEIICNERNLNIGEILTFGRKGITGERRFNEIGIHSLRIGDIVGEHSVFYGGIGEIIEISHRCYNREVFALGALKATKFLNKKEKGFYSMEDYIQEEVINV
ncbi:MAG: 4-hydroxy-tetrahydrodipicolinate reductase [Candidatus Omnitrophica bacterium]|nr:4-hydroxy-tetrahydrodipicolinate reductase [Candidatus Omnitrophota bacterium]MCM8809021.1 4-hydroxy-tetrahydrodipicolinate reductase [Candidatus Omnitrophota bacterium]MCM8810227.1 4-hydroxy-tetrahydrodipicolinate reductase [Candidatus Omnitrophota bacterium]